MLKPLDDFRILYKQETNKDFHSPFLTKDNQKIFEEFLTNPTWDYVCWLEERLSKYERVEQNIKTEFTSI